MLRNSLALIGLLVVAAACAGSATNPVAALAVKPAYPADPGAITVCAGENFYGDILHQLGGAKVRVYSFISDPNADPHQFEAAPANAKAVADSRLVVENGLGYDAFIDHLLKASPNSQRKLINVQQLVGAPDGVNAHLWYDPTVMPKVAEAMARALAAVDLANADTYRTNLSTVLASLQTVNDRVAALKPKVQGMPIAFTEPVYADMAAALGLDVKSPLEFMKAVEQGNDPPSSAVAAEQDLITKHQVKALLYNGQTVTKVTRRVHDLARQNNVPVVGISETSPPASTYVQWQLNELGQVAAALGVT
jgi:zinc/manganese transport system substrate-binding protein